MARPLRIEYPGALYHVTSRGDRCRPIFHEDADRRLWRSILGNTCERANLIVHAYCQMDNHFHLMVETPDGNLARGMRLLNATYTQVFNLHHGLAGHVYQGRYKAILVDKSRYLLELARYIVLNPVRAGIVPRPHDWPWGSFAPTIGACAAPPWLHTDWILSQFGSNRAMAMSAYQAFVLEGVGRKSPLKAVQHQVILGDPDFVELHRNRLDNVALTAIVKDQRRMTALALPQYAATFSDRNKAIAAAYRSTAYTMREIGEYFGVSLKTVSRAVRAFDGRCIELP